MLQASAQTKADSAFGNSRFLTFDIESCSNLESVPSRSTTICTLDDAHDVGRDVPHLRVVVVCQCLSVSLMTPKAPNDKAGSGGEMLDLLAQTG